MILIGIDPGLTGALSKLGPTGYIDCVDIPTMVRGTGEGSVKNQVNPAALASLLREWCSGHDKNEVLVLIENQRPMPAVKATPGKGKGFQITQGSASIFSLGMTAGIIEGVVAAIGLSYHLVEPGEWKKALKLKATGPDKKAVARAMAQRLFPQAPLAREKDHNRAESLLIAHYGYGQHA